MARLLLATVRISIGCCRSIFSVITSRAIAASIAGESVPTAMDAAKMCGESPARTVMVAASNDAMYSHSGKAESLAIFYYL